MTTQNATDDVYKCEPNMAEAKHTDTGTPPLDDLFAALRDYNVATIEGDVCCSGCMSAAAGGCMADLEDNEHEVIGYAGYHEQNLNLQYDPHDDMEYVTYDVEYMYLGYDGHGDHTAQEVGELIEQLAGDLGYDTEWSGDSMEKVKVYV